MPFLVCIFFFRADGLILDNLLLCSSLGRTASCAPIFTQVSVVLCAELKPHGLVPIQFGMFLGVVLV